MTVASGDMMMRREGDVTRFADEIASHECGHNRCWRALRRSTHSAVVRLRPSCIHPCRVFRWTQPFVPGYLKGLHQPPQSHIRGRRAVNRHYHYIGHRCAAWVGVNRAEVGGLKLARLEAREKEFGIVPPLRILFSKNSRAASGLALMNVWIEWGVR